MSYQLIPFRGYMTFTTETCRLVSDLVAIRIDDLSGAMAYVKANLDVVMTPEWHTEMKRSFGAYSVEVEFE